jgi:adenylate kinase family enzyme
VSVVGNSDSGKSSLARRIAGALDVPYVELDAIHHLAGWQPIAADEFQQQVRAATAGDGWVVDGNYRVVVMDGPVWERVDTVVWLDLPRAVDLFPTVALGVRERGTESRSSFSMVRTEWSSATSGIMLRRDAAVPWISPATTDWSASIGPCVASSCSAVADRASRRSRATSQRSVDCPGSSSTAC